MVKGVMVELHSFLWGCSALSNKHRRQMWPQEVERSPAISEKSESLCKLGPPTNLSNRFQERKFSENRKVLFLSFSFLEPSWRWCWYMLTFRLGDYTLPLKPDPTCFSQKFYSTSNKVISPQHFDGRGKSNRFYDKVMSLEMFSPNFEEKSKISPLIRRRKSLLLIQLDCLRASDISFLMTRPRASWSTRGGWHQGGRGASQLGGGASVGNHVGCLEMSFSTRHRKYENLFP